MKNGQKMAFPISYEMGGTFYTGKGLTKHEYFAAMAMQGFNANPELIEIDNTDIAELSVECAEALLDALEERD